jgi:hypothetical protein
MYCPKCGKENPEGARFCMHCGADLSECKVEISPNINVSPKIEVKTSTEKKEGMCAICGEKRAVVKCEECGRRVCNYHFEDEYRRCSLCALVLFKQNMNKCKKDAEVFRPIFEGDTDMYDVYYHSDLNSVRWFKKLAERDRWETEYWHDDFELVEQRLRSARECEHKAEAERKRDGKDAKEKEIRFDTLTEQTEGYSEADIRHICVQASLIPFKKLIKTGAVRRITMEDIHNVMETIKPSINREMVKKYREFKF